jgi:hypothetical protein
MWVELSARLDAEMAPSQRLMVKLAKWARRQQAEAS